MLEYPPRHQQLAGVASDGDKCATVVRPHHGTGATAGRIRRLACGREFVATRPARTRRSRSVRILPR
jgi:hypothetical protein